MTLARSHRKRLYPVHFAVAFAGRLSSCALFFTAKRLHSVAQGRRAAAHPGFRLNTPGLQNSRDRASDPVAARMTCRSTWVGGTLPIRS